MYSLRRGAAEAIEVVVRGDRRSSRVVGRELDDLELPESTTIGGIVRGHGLTRKALEAAVEAVRGGAKVDSANAEDQRQAHHCRHHPFRCINNRRVQI